MFKPGVVAFLLVALPAIAAPVDVRLGSEVLADHGYRELRNKRIALITNQTGVDRRGRSIIDLLRNAPGVRLVALMAPEHGLRGEFPAGREFPDSTDARSGLRVFSLYGPGPARRPSRAMLAGIDTVVYDVQDIGIRSYTYISTLGMAMDACGEAGAEFMVLDRPDPLGGQRVEGPMVDNRFRSFVSRWDIPYAYGLTPGELARMINGQGWITNRCKLTVVPLRGWRRTMVWRDTGLRWVPTSPNVPDAETALHLVATGVLGEIGGLSVGVGTDGPFQYVGAPWLDPRRFTAALNRYGLKGVDFEPATFRPARGLFKDQEVHGARIRLRDPAGAPLVALNFYALEAVRTTSGRDVFAEAVRQGRNFAMFDKVNGTDATRRALQSGQSAAAIVASWGPGIERFRRLRGPYLLY